MGWEVVGRRSPVSEICAPDRALNRVDLPPRWSADHGEERGLGVLEPGQEVVVELCEEFDPRLPGAFGPRQREWKTHGGDTVAQGGKCVDELRPYVHGHHIAKNAQFWRLFEAYRPLCAAVPPLWTESGQRGRVGRRHNECTTPGPQGAKSGAGSAPTCDYRFASPNLHIVPRR
ncbi:hypothetical protein SMICM17S_08336 [Streptomyces microflavus]